LDDFVDTAAVMKNLDLVITSDTSIAHLAGSLGVPVWVALHEFSDWRWLQTRDDCPWYPTMRLFRQTRLGQWEDVFHRIGDALQERLAAPAELRPITVEIAPGELIEKIASQINELPSPAAPPVRAASTPARCGGLRSDLPRYATSRGHSSLTSDTTAAREAPLPLAHGDRAAWAPSPISTG
jgi:hypothetical protein